MYLIYLRRKHQYIFTEMGGAGAGAEAGAFFLPRSVKAGAGSGAGAMRRP